MPDYSKKNYTKTVDRTNVRKERFGFIEDHSMIKKGNGLRNQINLYWKRRKEEKKNYT